MATSFDRTLVELDRSRFLRITAGTGATVACLEGCLWVTRDGTAADIQVEAGDSYRVADASTVLVNAFGPSRPGCCSLRRSRRGWICARRRGAPLSGGLDVDSVGRPAAHSAHGACKPSLKRRAGAVATGGLRMTRLGVILSRHQ